MDAGSSASTTGGSGSVTRICRRSGVTGSSTPARAPSSPDHAPAAHTTAPARTTPAVVRTRVPSPSGSNPRAPTPVSTRAPCRRAPAAYPSTTDSGAHQPSPAWKVAARTSSVVTPGARAAASARESNRVGTPSSFCRATAAANASASSASVRRNRYPRRCRSISCPGRRAKSANAASPRAPSTMLSASENCARTPPAALDVDPAPSPSRSRSRTSTPASARWKAVLVPMTPPPTTTTSARAGSAGPIGPGNHDVGPSRRRGAVARLRHLPPRVVLQRRPGDRTHERHAAVREPGRAGDVAGTGTAEERDDLGHLAGVARASERDAGAGGLRRVLVLLAGHGGRDLAGAHAVDGDPVLAELQRHDLGEQPQPGFRRAVGAVADPRVLLVDARDVHDAPAAAGGDHPARRALGADERRVEVDREHLAPLVVGEVEERHAGPRAGVVDEDVDAAERVGELVDDVGRLGQLVQVDVGELGPPAGRPDQLGGLLAHLLVAVPGDADVAAEVGEGDGDGSPDAGLGAGHDRALRDEITGVDGHDAPLPIHRAVRAGPEQGTLQSCPRPRSSSSSTSPTSWARGPTAGGATGRPRPPACSPRSRRCSGRR